MKAKLLLILGIVLLSYATLGAVRMATYDEIDNNCVNTSLRWEAFFNTLGLDAEVMVGWNDYEYGHAWVNVNGYDIDVTNLMLLDRSNYANVETYEEAGA